MDIGGAGSVLRRGPAAARHGRGGRAVHRVHRGARRLAAVRPAAPGRERPFTAAPSGPLLERMRELDVPLAIEWVHDVTPRAWSTPYARRGRSRSRSCRCWCCSRTRATAGRGRRRAADAGARGRGPPGLGAAASRSWRSARRMEPASRRPAARRGRRAARPRRCGRSCGRARRGSRSPSTRSAASWPPVATCRWASVTEVVGVATLPAEQGARLGSAVTQVLVEDARARGIGTIFLTASSERVARIYGRSGLPAGGHGVRRGGRRGLRRAPELVTPAAALVGPATDARGRCPGQDPCETAMHLPHHRRSRSLGDHLFRGLANAFATGIALEAFILAAAGNAQLRRFRQRRLVAGRPGSRPSCG